MIERLAIDVLTMANQLLARVREQKLREREQA